MPSKKTMTAANKNILRTSLFMFTWILCICHNAFAQEQDTASIQKRRMKILTISGAVTYGAAYAGFYQLWYKNSPRQDFTFFNDNAEWKQMDKLGHFYTAFYFSWTTSKAMRWAQVKPSRADLIGALAGFMVVAPIELFDGFSADYGASTGDLIADASGSLFFFGQRKLWNEVRLIPKFSFHQTDYAALRPHLLGDTPVSRVFKDYNGQTYWMSVDMDKFVPFPKWLNLAIGYGADGMIYARDRENEAAGFHPIRQYYLSLDFDLTGIPTHSKFLKTIFFALNTVKIPAPTLQFSERGSRFRALGY